MCLIFHFSKYLFLSILTEWLTCRDLIYFQCSLANKTDSDIMQTISENHRQQLQAVTHGGLGLSTFSHCMVRWIQARGFDFNEFKLKIYPQDNRKDFEAITSEIEHNDRNLKMKFECMSVIHRMEIGNAKSKDVNVIARLLPCFCNLEELSMPCSAKYIVVAQYCTNLKSLRIHKVGSQLPKFQHVFRHCKQLEEFQLEQSNNFDSSDAMYVLISAIIVHGDRLNSLSFIGVRMQKAMALLNAFKTRRYLRSFTVTCSLDSS